MIIIGITGTLGAGKGTIVDFLVKNKGYLHFSVRGYLLKIIAQKGLPQNRDSMVVVANDLRSRFSSSFIIEELYNEAKKIGKNSIIESIRTVGEIISLRQKGNFYLFAVDAEPEIRYRRIISRASETDHISFDTFLENEKREMTSDDENKQNLSKCIEMADFVLQNNDSIDVLNKQIESIINGIGY